MTRKSLFLCLENFAYKILAGFLLALRIALCMMRPWKSEIKSNSNCWASSSISFSENGTIISAKTFQKKLPEKKIVIIVDKSGDPPYLKNPKTKGVQFNFFGYNKVYNENDEIWMDGIFKNGQLWDGKVYTYDKDGILQRVLVYKEGQYHSEGQL